MTHNFSVIMSVKRITQSAEETQKLGEKIARGLSGGEVLALYGELGSGKTTFVQGLARGLGIKKRILSPSFTLIRPYTIHHTLYTFYHIDLYRLNSFKEAEGLGLEEILADKGAIVAIEWAEKSKKILPAKRIDVIFKYKKENTREIHFNTLK